MKHLGRPILSDFGWLNIGRKPFPTATAFPFRYRLRSSLFHPTRLRYRLFPSVTDTATALSPRYPPNTVRHPSYRRRCIDGLFPSFPSIPTHYRPTSDTRIAASIPTLIPLQHCPFRLNTASYCPYDNEILPAKPSFLPPTLTAKTVSKAEYPKLTKISQIEFEKTTLQRGQPVI